MLINVTQSDIDNGIATEPSMCPLALAIKRAIPGSYVSVGTRDVHIAVPGVHGTEVYAMGKGLSHFTEDFDAGKQVSPFEFELAYQEEPIEA